MKSIYKILLIDDDEDEFVILQDILLDIPESDYQIDWEDNYENALDTIQGNQYDVVLIDYRLGPETGISIIKKAQVKGIDIPFILMTGQEQREVDENALNVGAADYLVKGQMDANQIDRSIRYSLERARISKELQQKELRLLVPFKAAHIGIWEWDDDTKLIQWPSNAGSLLGDDNIKIPDSFDAYLQIIHPADREAFIEANRKVIKGGLSFEFEYRIILPDGSVKWIESRGGAITKDQRTVKLTGIFMDISARFSEESSKSTTSQAILRVLGVSNDI